MHSTTKTPKTTEGYQSIGSFHSDNVEHLMSQSDADYIPPSLPFFESTAAATPKRHDVVDDQDASGDFLLDRSQWTFLNHGAFGAALRVGYDRAQAWRWHLEQQPLRYFDRDLLPHLVYTTRRLAHFMNASTTLENGNCNSFNGLALLPNVTSGLSAILRNHARMYPNAKIILWDTTYGSVKKMARTFYEPHRIIEIPLLANFLPQLQTAMDHEAAEQVFVTALQETLASPSSSSSWCNDFHNSLLILDQTTSNTALNVPLLKLAKAAKQHDPTMIVCVDGAHGLLAQDVNLQQLIVDIATTSTTMVTTTSNTADAKHSPHAIASSTSTGTPAVDLYLSNGHKWLSCPRGIAVIYASSLHIRESLLRVPAVLSHGIDDGYLSRFIWDGCRDYAAALAVPAVLDYWTQRYPQLSTDLHPYLQQGLVAGVDCLIQKWYGQQHVPPSEWHLQNYTLAPILLCGPMALVRLPLERLSLSHTDECLWTSAHAKQIQDYLYHHHIEVPIKCVNDQLYVRVSYHVYNTLDDFERLAQQMLQFPK